MTEVLPINIEFGMARRYVEIQVGCGVWQTHRGVLYVPHRGNVDVVIHVLLDYYWTLWTVHVQMMSMRIHRIANSATQDNANVKAAMWPVVVDVVHMTMPVVLGPMLVSYAMPPCMGRRLVVLSPMLVHVVMVLPTLMSIVVGQRWS